MDTNRYISLIQRSLNQQLNTKEQSELDEWRSASKENEELYAEMLKLWQLADEYDEPVEADVEADLLKVMTEVKCMDSQASASTAKVRTFNSWKTWVLSAAACLLLIIGVIGINNGDSNELSYIATLDNELVELPDASTVLLASGSKLTWTEDWSQQRTLELDGTGFFEIQKNNSKPLKIKGRNSNLTVLGTSFVYASSSSGSYIDLYEGKVKIEYAAQTKTIIADNEIQSFRLRDNMIQSQPISKQSYSWCKPQLKFNNKNISEVVRLLSHWYGLKVSLGKSLEKCKLTANLGDTSPETVMERIALLIGAEYSYDGNTHVLAGNGC